MSIDETAGRCANFDSRDRFASGLGLMACTSSVFPRHPVLEQCGSGGLLFRTQIRYEGRQLIPPQSLS